MEIYAIEWTNLLLRWLHFITGIAWIGSSIYFVMLDTSLRPSGSAEDARRGVLGELWEVHGGGFYSHQKYLTGPKGEPLTEDLHWHKWESYTTWLSGMGLLAVIYWWGASSFLIDKNVMDLSPAQAIGISIGSIVLGWLVYDGLCRAFWQKPTLLVALIFVFLLVMAYALFHVFGARAAYIHLGVMMGTMMSWNVFLHIIPGQKRMVAAIRAGQPVDPMPGKIGKVRSTHNTYFTLPVLFTMISNHYPMTYSNKYGWVALVLIGLAGVLIRQFFVLRHTVGSRPAYPIAAVILLGIVAAMLAPVRPAASVALGGAAPTFAKIQPIIAERCAGCHAAVPTQPGFASAPNGLMLDTPDRIKAAAPKIEQQAVTTQAMPIGNLTQMTPEERVLVGQWISAGAKLQ